MQNWFCFSKPFYFHRKCPPFLRQCTFFSGNARFVLWISSHFIVDFSLSTILSLKVFCDRWQCDLFIFTTFRAAMKCKHHQSIENKMLDMNKWEIYVCSKELVIKWHIFFFIRNSISPKKEQKCIDKFFSHKVTWSIIMDRNGNDELLQHFVITMAYVFYQITDTSSVKKYMDRLFSTEEVTKQKNEWVNKCQQHSITSISHVWSSLAAVQTHFEDHNYENIVSCAPSLGLSPAPAFSSAHNPSKCHLNRWHNLCSVEHSGL